jgi:thymidylate kinase
MKTSSSSPVRRIGRRLRPTTPWLAVLGPDGSGKTSVIDALTRIWPPDAGVVRRHHWRPHVLGRRPGAVTIVSDPHGKPDRPWCASVAKLVLLLLDWWVGNALVLSRERARGDLVVFDRCFLDLLCDPRRYRYGASLRLARWVSVLVPHPTLVVVLDAPVAVLHSRKLEVPALEVERQRRAYRRLVDQERGAVLIDARQEPHVTAGQIAERLQRVGRATED